MQFGPLTTRQAMESRFKEMRVQSRQQLLSKIYNKSVPNVSEKSIQSQLSQAFSLLLHNYQFSKNNPIVIQISQLFGINLDSIAKLQPKERKEFLESKIQSKIEDSIKIVDRIQQNHIDQARNSNKSIHEDSNHFEWLGVNSKYMQLRPIFEEILLEKVKLFDRELTQLTQLPEQLPYSTIDAPTTVRTNTTHQKSNNFLKNRTASSTVSLRHRKVQSTIEPEFTNVKIRDKSQFLLGKWTKKQQEEFLSKKAVFKSNLKINNIPVLFQFVKKYTTTVKARDNIYRKWEQRQKLGISPEQLRYLCATSLFLNKTMAKSQKVRIKNNIKAAGGTLISRLEYNISEKIIQTYHQLMKKVSDLRAKYYEQLTQERKLEQHNSSVVEQTKEKVQKREMVFLKYKATFQRIVNSQKMKLKLNPKTRMWVQHFISNLLWKVRKAKTKKSIPKVFKRLATQTHEDSLIYKHKKKYPSAKIIKRQDMYSHRLKYRKYIPGQRFFYEKKFQETIDQMNKVKLNPQHSYSYNMQISGGPKKRTEFVTVDLSKKKVYMSSPLIVKYVIKIQAKWRAVSLRNKYLLKIQQIKEKRMKDFQAKLESLKKIYPLNKKIDMKAVENRLKRIHMKISNIIRPYERVIRRPINIYTSFCVSNLTNVELKNKHARNGAIRIGQFNKMVEKDHYHQLKKSGIVVTSKQINDCVLRNDTNPMWWSVYHCNLELTTRFLQGGGDPNSKDADGQTCLHIAFKNGAVPIIFILLDYGADLNRKNNKKVSSLFYATKRMLKLLGLEEGSVVGDRDNNSTFYRRTNHFDVYKEHHY